MNSSPIVLILLALTTFATAAPNGGNPFVADNDVTWTKLGTNEGSSMPLGKGDVALNVWTEQNGDIVLLIAKSDAWSENGELLKPGRVRVSLDPNPFVNSASFTQILRLESGDVELHSSNNFARIWVDANKPVVHVQVQTEAPIGVTSEVWRTEEYGLDTRAMTTSANASENNREIPDADLRRKIEERAYHIWLGNGGGHGDRERHWLQAESELMEATKRRGTRQSDARSRNKTAKPY